MKTPSVMAILQARMASSRLPGKMLLPIIGKKGALELMLGRVGRARKLSRVVVATTHSPVDNPLEAICDRLRVPCFRGSEPDVLDRFYQAARALDAPPVLVRLTGDCPLHDPQIIDEAIEAFEAQGVDYISNADPPTLPDGLDTEVFTREALESAWREARLPSEREHVTPFIRQHPERFKLGRLVYPRDLSGLRWTLDEPGDLELIRALYGRLGERALGFRDVLELLEREPGLQGVNAGIQRNEGYLKSLQKDRET